MLPHFTLYLFFLVFLLVIGPADAGCPNCKPGEICRDGICLETACDGQSRWYILPDSDESTGYISDGPGNYSANMKCTWLIDARKFNRGTSKAKIRLRVDNFITECAWDHLYVWDGDSTESPLLASLSGTVQDSPGLFEITTTSGAAFIHFYSDPAFTMAGFNISYEIDGCELDCSSRSAHGTCITLASNGGTKNCICEHGWTGAGCDVPLGCDKSYSCQNGGTCVGEGCVCPTGFKGPDCGTRSTEGTWEKVLTDLPSTTPPPPSASHAIALHSQYVYWIGGETFQKGVDLRSINRFNMASLTFESVPCESVNNPLGRFGHTVISYNDSLFMFGGIVNGTTPMNEFWEWQATYRAWVPRKYEGACRFGCAPFPTAGHTAHLIGNKMLIIFGYGGSEYGFLNIVQEFDFVKKKWSVPQTTGSYVFGTYGHTSVYDKNTNQIFIHGGYAPSPTRQYVLAERLLSYDPQKAFFRKLTGSPLPRFLHSAVILNRQILFFGGNQHSESSSVRNGAPCYTNDFFAYDIECDSWIALKPPFIPYSNAKISRYGHSAINFKGSMWIFGGFHGILLNDVLKFSPGDCTFWSTKTDCLTSGKSGLKCMWSERSKQCLDPDTGASISGAESSKCKKPTEEVEDPYCAEQSNCHDCLSGQSKCFWCKDGNTCSSSACKTDITQVSTLEFCPRELNVLCMNHFSCQACVVLSNSTCVWRREDGHVGSCVNSARYSSSGTDLLDATASVCDLPCSGRMTCDTCSTQSGQCMWCANEQKCIESNAYLAVFPYGQCRDWQAMNRRCGRLSPCEDFKSCDHCMENPDCGWCDDGSQTGLGRCWPGSSRGPKKNEDVCPVDRWFFVKCPLCNCNGHAYCLNGTGMCGPCGDFTEGIHCDRCVAGRFGDPRNGGNCTLCNCPANAANGCDPENGNCKCTTKGTTGRRCDRCDEANHYVGSDGICFYELPVGFQFTFNMTKVEDQHLTGINFKTTPHEKDYDVKFSILCTNLSLVNVTYKTTRMLFEETLFSEVPCSLDSKIERVLSHDQLPFGQEGLNTTIFVYVHDFSTPTVIVISFAQHASLDLLHFFVVFACCFLSLLLLAAVLWKVKQKYDIYRRRQRMFVEMEQMAKRPFANVILELPRAQDQSPSLTRRRPQRLSRACLVAIEPLSDGKNAAIFSTLLQLPTGDGNYTAPGQAGLAVASTLVTYGSQMRRLSIEQKPDKKQKTVAEAEL